MACTSSPTATRTNTVTNSVQIVSTSIAVVTGDGTTSTFETTLCGSDGLCPTVVQTTVIPGPESTSTAFITNYEASTSESVEILYGPSCADGNNPSSTGAGAATTATSQQASETTFLTSSVVTFTSSRVTSSDGSIITVPVTLTSTGVSTATGSTTKSTSASRSTTNKGAIIGGVIGGVVGLALVALAFYLCMAARKKRRHQWDGVFEDVLYRPPSDGAHLPIVPLDVDADEPTWRGGGAPGSHPPYEDTDPALGAGAGDQQMSEVATITPFPPPSSVPSLRTDRELFVANPDLAGSSQDITTSLERHATVDEHSEEVYDPYAPHAQAHPFSRDRKHRLVHLDGGRYQQHADLPPPAYHEQ
ncbi:hypothetical protein EV122DRAFT_208340 [Schizophyllum commune]